MELSFIFSIVSFKDLYAAFSSAFKDYDFSLNADELRRMLD